MGVRRMPRAVSKRAVQLLGGLNSPVPPGPAMRINRIEKFMITFISIWIRIDRRTEEAEAQDIAFDTVTIFSVVQQTDSITRFTDVHPPVSRNFEFRLIPWGISVVRPGNRAKSGFRPHLVRSDPDRKKCAEQPSPPGPMYFAVYFQDSGKSSEPVSLGNFDGILPACDLQSSAQWSAFDHLGCGAGTQFRAFITI